MGTGKTHLAIATGSRACELGRTVKFYTVAELVMRLAEAKRSGTLERLMSEVQRCQLLILDEWGYIPVDKDGSQLLLLVGASVLLGIVGLGAGRDRFVASVPGSARK